MPGGFPPYALSQAQQAPQVLAVSPGWPAMLQEE